MSAAAVPMPWLCGCRYKVRCGNIVTSGGQVCRACQGDPRCREANGGRITGGIRRRQGDSP